MTTRTVTGTVLGADLTVPASIVFTLLDDFVSTAGTEYLSGDVTVTPDSVGAFSVNLPVPDTGTAVYVIRLPGRNSVSVNLGVGASVDLATLLLIPVASGSQDALQTLLDVHKTEVDPHELSVNNVKSYGAVGNGIVDDSAAIQAAIDAAVLAGGGEVSLPLGTYLTDQLNYGDNITIAGSGIGKTVLKLNAAQDTPIICRIDAYLGDHYPTINTLPAMNNVTIHDLTLDGNYSNQSGATAASWDWVIFFQRIINGHIYNVEVKDGQTGGIVLSQCKHTIVENNWLSNNVRGNSDRNELTSFRNFEHTNPPVAGDAGSLGGYNIMRDNIVSHRTGSGYVCYTISSEYIDGDIISGNECAYAMIGMEGVRYGRITNNTIRNSPTGGIQITEGENRTPTGLIVANNIILYPEFTALIDEARGVGIQCVVQVNAVIANNTIMSPVFHDTGGISVTWGAIAAVTSPGAVIQGNTIINSAAGMRGVIAHASPGAIISNNELRMNAEGGIYIYLSDEVVSSSNRIDNIGAQSTFGIVTYGSNACIFIGNIIKNFGYAIGVYGDFHCLSNDNILINTPGDYFEEYAGSIAYGNVRTVNHYISSAAPTIGRAGLGDIVWNGNPASGQPAGWICTHAGTFSTATDNTGDTDGTTAVITGMTDTSDFAVGDYVDVSAGFATTGAYKIIAKTATTITLQIASDAVATNITVSTSDPVWTAMANLA